MKGNLNGNLEQVIDFTIAYLTINPSSLDKEEVVNHLVKVLGNSVKFRESISNMKGI